MASTLQNAPVVLVVDDDPVIQNILGTFFESEAITILHAASGDEAVKLLLIRGIESVDCVLTDYHMPGMSGLALISWLMKMDPTLAAIIFTAHGGMGVVAESLRLGAVDFLEKPVSFPVIVKTIHKAIATTRARRRGRLQADSVRQLGQIKDRLQRLRPVEGLCEPELMSHAKAEVGGDFAEVFPLGPKRFLLLCGDVSGHDLRAGFISAYFQGLVRGLLKSEAGMPEIAQLFNQILINEWNQKSDLDCPLSLSVSFILVDFPAKKMEFLGCGFPSPFLANQRGEINEVSVSTSPLGWFAETSRESIHLEVEEGQTLSLFTDGLEEMAERLGVHPCSMSYRLLDKNRSEELPELIASARDDVLALRWCFSESCQEEDYLCPLLFARYPGNSSDHIDVYQAGWERSLSLAISPEQFADRFCDVLVCLREAVLNGLKHGCHEAPDLFCSVAISYNQKKSHLRLLVQDQGSGHDFDVEQRIRDCKSLHERNLGLTIIYGLANQVTSDQLGSRLSVDFFFSVDSLVKIDSRAN